MRSETQLCHFCEMPVSARPYARRGEIYCCEGCFLKQQEFYGALFREQQAHSVLAEALVTALDVREHEIGLHSKRVACHTLVLARRFSDDAEQLHQVYWGALLHDIGKIGIPDAILRKTAPLTGDEWTVMRTHPELGCTILKDVPFMERAAEIVRAHQERYDGSGYPRGLKGDAIPWGARLFAVIDTLDAMTSDRSYRRALTFDTAKAEIEHLSKIQFDPQAVAAFEAEQSTLREMVALKCGEAALPANLARRLNRAPSMFP
jgi:putative nucleotidyltransferase with HDIG domain